jgi:formate/nitrite transporter FocA (FNT family)
MDIAQEEVKPKTEIGLPQSFMEPKSISETLDTLTTIAVTKWSRPLGFFFQSIVGGAMVGFGVILAIAVGAGISTPGIANLVSGLVFGFSFVAILVSGASLITSDMAAGFVAVSRRKLKFISYIKFLLVGWIGNTVGMFIFIGIVAAGPGAYAKSIFLDRAHMIALSKVGPDDISVFCMAIICTWLLQTSFFLYVKGRTDIGKMVVAWYGPLAFVAGMTEHCIANIGFIGLPLLMQSRYIALNSTALANHDSKIKLLTWGFGHFGLLRNELIVWAGNWIGGTVFVAILFMLISWAYGKNRPI